MGRFDSTEQVHTYTLSALVYKARGLLPPCLWKGPHSPVIALVIDTVTLFISCFSCLVCSNNMGVH